MADRVLIVEDNLMLAETYAEIFAGFGYEVVGHAVTGESAVDAAVRQRPDLVLMDISLKGPMDGIEAARRIVGHAPVPVIFISGLSDEKRRRMIDSIPHCGYVMKPVDFNVLEKTAAGMLEAARKRRT